MPEETYQEKTEKPTAKKLADARKEGNIARSTEIPSVLILSSSLGVFFFAGSWMFWSLSEFMGGVFQNIGALHFQESSLHSFLLEIFGQILSILMPLLLAILIAGIAGNLLQFGFLFTIEPFTPKISRFNPIAGIKKIVSLRSVVEVIKALFKFLFIGGIAVLLIRGEMDSFPALMDMSVGDILCFIGRVAFKVCFYVCLSLIVLAGIDFAYQRWQHEKDLKMTRQEVKDESKQTEGDPKVKGRIRRIQIETARRRMMEQIPESDVVITNPTRLAIALKYDPEEMMAPRVMAKGAGYIARRIREIAQKNGVPIVENKTLAQTLFKAIEIGEYIPANLYRAVAEVLAYVYRLKEMNNEEYA